MAPDAPLTDPVHQNIEGILTFHRRENEKLTAAERRLERLSGVIGKPVFLGALGLVVAAWIGLNLIVAALGRAPPDPPPFAALQGLLTLAALVTTTIILSTQRRQARLERSRDHLDLQVNLLTEQKVTKLIHLIEELRRDLPMVENRVDPEVTVLQQRADAMQVLSALQAVTDSMEIPDDPTQVTAEAPGPNGG